MPDAKDFLRAVKYLAKGVVGESGHFSDEMLQQIGKVIQDNPNDLKNLPDLIKEDLEKAGHKLSDEAIDFLEKGNFKLFKDPKKLEALSNFGVKLSTAFDGADELADDFVKTELDTLAKELAIGSGVKDKWFGPLEKQYTALFNGREKLIDRLFERNVLDQSIDVADARPKALKEYADAMASAKETLNARKGIDNTTPAPGGTGATPAPGGAGAPPAPAKDKKTLKEKFYNGVNSIKDEAKYLSKVKPDDPRFTTYKEMGWYQRTVDGRMNIVASTLESYATVRGVFAKEASHDAPFKTVANWLNSGEKFINHRINSLDTVLKDSGAFHSFAQLESNMKKAVNAINDGQPFTFHVGNTPHTIQSGVTEANIGQVLEQISNTHTANKAFTDSLTDVKKHLVDWEDYVRNKMFVTGSDEKGTKYTWRKGCTENMKVHELRVIDKFSNMVDRMATGQPSNNDFLTQMQDQIATMRAAKNSPDEIKASLDVMTTSSIGEFGEQHMVRTEGFYLSKAKNANGSFDGSFAGVDTLNFTPGDEEKNYLRRFGLMKEIEQCAVLEKADTQVPGAFGQANAGSKIGVADQYLEYIESGEWTSTGRNDYPGQLASFYDYGRPGRIAVNQCLEYMSLARGAKNLDTVPKDLGDQLGKLKKTGEDHRNQFLKNVSKQSELVGDGGARGDARDIWAKFSAPMARHRITDITERNVISFKSNPVKWLLKWGGQSGPAADNLWVMARNKGFDTMWWALGGEKTGKGPAFTMGRTWGKEFAGFEVEGKWRALNTLHSVTTRPAVTNMLHALRPSTTLMEFPFKVSMSNVYQASAVAAGLGTGLSIGKYTFISDENEEKAGVHVWKTGVDALHTVSWAPTKIVSLYGNIHNLAFDKGLGAFLRDVEWMGKDETTGLPRDFSALSQKYLKVESEGGLPVKQVFDKIVMNFGHDSLDKYLDRREYNAEARARQDRQEAQEREQELQDWTKKNEFHGSNSTGSKPQTGAFNHVSGKPEEQQEESGGAFDYKSKTEDPVKTQLTGKFDDTGSLKTADPNTQFVDMMKDTTTTSGDEGPSQDYFMLNTLLSVK